MFTAVDYCKSFTSYFFIKYRCSILKVTTDSDSIYTCFLQFILCIKTTLFSLIKNVIMC